MKTHKPNPSWSLPYDTPRPEDPQKRKRVAVFRVLAYVLFAGALITPIIQFQVGTLRNARRGADFDRKYPGWTRAVTAAGGPKRPKAHKGAIGRWCKAVRPFWAGENIYRRGRLDAGLESTAQAQPGQRPIRMHPNMPFVVILLTPFAYLPTGAMALCWSLLKLPVLVGSVLMIAQLVADKDKRPPDWVLALGVLWSLLMIIDSMLHGSTNVFVLGAITLHLWLYRRGRDWWSGAALALAICLKMTPAIFLLYWLYQRSWKVLTATVAALLIMAVIIPAAALGPQHYATLTRTWLDNLIIPGLVKGAWYPIHINQSISGVFSRYFLPEGDPDSNIFWNPDDNPYSRQATSGWITLVSLSPAAVKMLIRVCQLVVVVLAGWAIGFRRLPRDDGRRALHYGLVTIVMLLANQRTWEHHGAVLLIATVAIWQAVAFGRLGRGVRPCAMGLTIAAGLVFWLTKSDLVRAIGRLLGKSGDQARVLADVVEAYGPFFFCLALLLAASVLLSVALRRPGPPYATERQKVFECTPSDTR